MACRLRCDVVGSMTGAGSLSIRSEHRLRFACEHAEAAAGRRGGFVTTAARHGLPPGTSQRASPAFVASPAIGSYLPAPYRSRPTAIPCRQATPVFVASLTSHPSRASPLLCAGRSWSTRTSQKLHGEPPRTHLASFAAAGASAPGTSTSVPPLRADADGSGASATQLVNTRTQCRAPRLRTQKKFSSDTPFSHGEHTGPADR